MSTSKLVQWAHCTGRDSLLYVHSMHVKCGSATIISKQTDCSWSSSNADAPPMSWEQQCYNECSEYLHKWICTRLTIQCWLICICLKMATMCRKANGCRWMSAFVHCLWGVRVMLFPWYWVSDTFCQGYTNLQTLVKCLDHRGIVSDTACSQGRLC